MSLLPPEQPNSAIGTGAASSASGAGAPVPPKPSEPPAAPAKPESSTSNLLSNLRVSLMPSDLEGRPAPNLKKGLIIMAAVLAVETVIIGVLYYMTGRAIASRVGAQASLQADIERTDKETAELEALSVPAIEYAYQLRSARDILDKHVYWTPFFAYLEKYTLPTVKFTTFTGDATTGLVSVDCIGATYRDVAQQIILLRESPMLSMVRSTAAAAKISSTGEIEGVTFSVSLKFKPDAWKLVTAPATTVPAESAPAPAPAPAADTPVPPIDTTSNTVDEAATPPQAQ